MMKRRTLCITALAAMAASHAIAVDAKPAPPAMRSAAQLRELSIMFSSVALRCNRIGINIQPDFDMFAEKQKGVLARTEMSLQQHFAVRTKADLHAEIDRYQIRVLNFYGTGRTDQQICSQFSNLLKRLAEGDAEGKLLGNIATVMVPEPLLEADQ
jgi:hypothetical protein